MMKQDHEIAALAVVPEPNLPAIGIRKGKRTEHTALRPRNHALPGT